MSDWGEPLFDASIRFAAPGVSFGGHYWHPCFSFPVLPGQIPDPQARMSPWRSLVFRNAPFWKISLT